MTTAIAPINDADSKVVNLLSRNGLVFETTEGQAFLLVKKSFFYRRISLSQDMKQFLTVLNSQPPFFFFDGGCRYSVREMANWALEWERFLMNNPTQRYAQEAKKRYVFFMDFIMFSDLPNTPAFPEYNRGKMDNEWMCALKSLAAETVGTRTAAIIADFLADVQANNNKLDKATKTRLSANLEAVFLPAEPSSHKPTAAIGDLSAAEQKILGKHMFSLQWIKGDKMAVAMVTRTPTGLRIDAKQHQGDFVTLQGDLTVIDDKTFIVTGELVTRVSHIDNGSVCPRRGTFEFKVKGIANIGVFSR